MSDPIARMYEMIIREELDRQERAEGRGEMYAGEIDVAALAVALANPKAPTDLLEPGAAGRQVPEMLSIAISAKRIADAMTDHGSIPKVDESLRKALARESSGGVVLAVPHTSRAVSALYDAAYKAAEQFRFYEAEHQRKETLAGDTKAATNRLMAESLERALGLSEPCKAINHSIF